MFSWELGQFRLGEDSLIPTSLANRLVEHVQGTGSEDNLRMIRSVLGSRPSDRS
jgi:hypothetical protein